MTRVRRSRLPLHLHRSRWSSLYPRRERPPPFSLAHARARGHLPPRDRHGDGVRVMTNAASRLCTVPHPLAMIRDVGPGRARSRSGRTRGRLLPRRRVRGHQRGPRSSHHRSRRSAAGQRAAASAGVTAPTLVVRARPARAPTRRGGSSARGRRSRPPRRGRGRRRRRRARSACRAAPPATRR